MRLIYNFLIFFLFFSSPLFSATSYSTCSGDWVLTSTSRLNVSQSDNAFKVLNGGTFWDCVSTLMVKYEFYNIDDALYTVDRVRTDYIPFNPSCVSPSVWDSDLQLCYSFCPDNDTILPIPENDCAGGSSFTLVDNGSGASYVDLYWQPCDSTCRGVKLNDLSCSDLAPAYQNQCDTSKNNFVFVCDDVNGVGTVNLSQTKCTPKSNPCNDMYDRLVPTCDVNQTLEGYPECKHDGNKVINPDVFKCIADDLLQIATVQKNCDYKWYETFNTVTNICECNSGYTRNDFGICSVPLDSNATAAQQQADADKNAQDAREKEKNKSDLNSSANTSRSLENIENTLSGVRSDLNTSNSLLDGIKGLMDDVSGKLDANFTDISSNPISSNLDDMKSEYSFLESELSDLKIILENGLVNPIPSGSSTSCLYSKNLVGLGLTIPVNIDVCEVVSPVYSTLYSIWYLLFFVFFLGGTFKLLMTLRTD